MLKRPASYRANKYRSKVTIYNGVKFASKAEAHRAMELDLLLKAGLIVEVIYQPRFRLGVPENKYVADFLVISNYLRFLKDPTGNPHPSIAWCEDVKGAETPKFVRDKKLWKAYGRLPLHIIRGGKTVEVIVPEGNDGK